MFGSFGARDGWFDETLLPIDVDAWDAGGAAGGDVVFCGVDAARDLFDCDLLFALGD
jgi:hypothetical protein